nr:lysM domain-containing GPI-anchored protein 2 [Ipomoea batatas]
MANSVNNRFLLVIIITTTISSLIMVVEAQSSSFKCSSSNSTCDAIIDYVSPNTTTLSAVKALFNVKNLRSILGANNLPLTTPPNQTLIANHTLKIPFICSCANGTGTSNKRPVYTVVPGDGLYHIAAEVFGNLVTDHQIQAANNIKDANLIFVGQKLWIPLPCSCDEVDGQRVLHYGHVVSPGSSVDAIAAQYNTSQDTLLRLNGLTSPKDLKAGAVLDVPLPTCTSMISNTSLDYPLLVPNGTYVFTAANCVMCKCDAANNWNLECERTEIKSSLWATCPSTPCQFGSGGGCGVTECAYAGYTNQTILTASAPNTSTCPPVENGGAILRQQAWGWDFLLISCFVFISTYLP